jgi:anti-sigma-K factor RskA
MQQSVEAPTPQALADLVARCTQITRFARQLTAVEEARIAALAAGILTMREVLELKLIPSHRLPTRQARVQHWMLAGGELSELATPAIRTLHGTLALDEHEQIKILSDRTWRGVWRSVTLWRDGTHGLAAHELMEYLARLASDAQGRAPAVARILLERSRAVASTLSLLPNGPRTRAD